MMSLPFAFSILFILSASIRSTSTTKLEARKPIDNLLNCGGEVPEEHSPLWPDDLSIGDRRFHSVKDLCAWSSESEQSVGCICFRKGDKPECLLQYADENLWVSADLRRFCKRLCDCPSTGQRRRTSMPPIQVPEPNPDGDELQFSFGPGSRLVRPQSQGSRNAIFFSFGRDNERRRHRLAYQETLADTDSSVANLQASSCPTACTTNNFLCTKDCHCSLDQVSQGLWRVMACVASGLGKRDGLVPVCPCNTTYVSRGCCGNEDGLVWEHPSQNLGQLEL